MTESEYNEISSMTDEMPDIDPTNDAVSSKRASKTAPKRTSRADVERSSKKLLLDRTTSKVKKVAKSILKPAKTAKTSTKAKTAAVKTRSKGAATARPRTKTVKTVKKTLNTAPKRTKRAALPDGQSKPTRGGKPVKSSWMSRTHARTKADKKAPVMCQRSSKSKIWKRDMVSVPPSQKRDVSCNRCLKVLNAS